jgi:hypothetical protein
MVTIFCLADKNVNVFVGQINVIHFLFLEYDFGLVGVCWTVPIAWPDGVCVQPCSILGIDPYFSNCSHKKVNIRLILIQFVNALNDVMLCTASRAMSGLRIRENEF